MEAFLTVPEIGEPTACASTSEGVFPLVGCKLTKHTNGSWNFNMSISSEYSAYKEGQRVNGDILGDKFCVWSLLSLKPINTQ